MELYYIKEPKLTFGYGQETEDPRDGLVLFGPHQGLSPKKLSVGFVGTSRGLELYGSFVKKLQKQIISTKKNYGKVKSDENGRPSFPGFETVFGVEWESDPTYKKEISIEKIKLLISEKNKRTRTSKLVDLYLSHIVDYHLDEDRVIDIWYIVVPRQLYLSCKPKSFGSDFSKASVQYINERDAGQQSLFNSKEDENYLDMIHREMNSSSDFHHLLKARLIQENINPPVQIMVEPTLAFRDKQKNIEFDENMKAHLAWTQSTSLYFKLGIQPWKLGSIRDGVCYLGLIFKKINSARDSRSVCSAAQMFLKDGDGAIFRGNKGNWQADNEFEFHLDKESSEDLLGQALDDYNSKWDKFPDEIFIHGRVHFNDSEWQGFNEAVTNRGAKTKLVGVVIKDTNKLKFFKDRKNEANQYGVLRGLAYIVQENEGYLFTRGFIPRLNTANTLEIPNSLHVQVTRGEAQIKLVLKDILALTKLNYNACIYGDGLPVTLRFSDKLASIITAIDEWKVDNRQFKYYI